MSSDWMPRDREGQLNMANNWVAVLSEVNPNPTPSGGMQTNAAAWGVPVELVTDLDGEAGKCFELLRKVNEPTTATAVVEEECREAFEALDETMRDRHQYFYLKAFPRAALFRLGLKPHKKPGAGGSVADPTDHVEYEISIDPIGRRIIIRFRILGSKRWGKGKYHCVEIRFWILPLDSPAPIDPNAPGWESDVDTASPWEITCDGADSGKRLWVAMRWENRSTGTKNQKRGKGPWSEIKGVVIP
jgi:hypothetical protein